MAVTLDSHIDSSFAYLMFDQAFFLLLVTTGLNIAVDAIARRYRPRDVVLNDPCSR